MRIWFWISIPSPSPELRPSEPPAAGLVVTAFLVALFIMLVGIGS